MTFGSGYGGYRNDFLLVNRRQVLFYLAGFLVIHNLVFLEVVMRTMEEVIEHQASECSKTLVKQLQAFESLVSKEFRTQFFEMIEIQLQTAFYTGLAKSRSIVRDRQLEVKEPAAEAAKWM